MSPQANEQESVAIVALANALLDLSIVIKNDSLIKKYGLPYDGQVEVTDSQQGLFTEVLQNHPLYVAGGSAQNTVRLIARLLNDDDERRTWASVVIGKIGGSHDPIGIILQRLLADDGVLTRYVSDETKPTGCCAALVGPDGTRCLAANIGAARGFQAEYLGRVGAFHLIDRTTVLYVEGFFAIHSPEASLAAIKYAHSRPDKGVVRVLSLSAQYVCRQFHEELEQLLPYANLVVGNEDEFRALAECRVTSSAGQVNPNSCRPISTIAREIASTDYISPVNQLGSSDQRRLLRDFHGDVWDWRQLDERLTVVTCGSAGAVCSNSSDTWEFPLSEPIASDQVVDTTGAGDAFLAGFLSQVIAQRSLQHCVAQGHRTAQIVISQVGCRLP